jgi:hypothetical protein
MINRRIELVWAVTVAAVTCGIGTIVFLAFFFMVPSLLLLQALLSLGGLLSIVGIVMSIQRPRLGAPAGINACVLLFNVGVGWLLASSVVQVR